MPITPGPHVSETAPRERRSLFPNYNAGAGERCPTSSLEPVMAGVPPGPDPRLERPIRRDPLAVPVSRCFLHQLLARAFEYPSPATWAWLTHSDTRTVLEAAGRILEDDADAPLRRAVAEAASTLEPRLFEGFHDDYVAAIGHAARGSSPINEIEYGEPRADPLLQPHRLADLAAFYRAFGLEPAPDGGERQDHLAVELEFMAVLTGQEAHAVEHRLADDVLAANLDAQRIFLREHLGRWSPTFARRLVAMVGDGVLRTVARLLLAFVESECRRAGVAAGSDDVTLRPADEGAMLCESCGIHQTLPGGAPPPET